MSLTHSLIAAHRALGGGASDDARGAAIAVRADHVLACDAAALVAFLGLETLGVARVAVEAALACVGRGSGLEADDLRYLQGAARKAGAFFSPPGNGAGHHAYRERFGAPGRLLIASDPDASACGALGMLAVEANPIEIATVLAGAPHRTDLPGVVGVWLDGTLAAGVGGLDLALGLARAPEVAQGRGWRLEFGGPGLGALPMAERFTLAAHVRRCGAAGAVLASDDATRAWMRALGREAEWKRLDCVPERSSRTVPLDLGAVEPGLAELNAPGETRPLRSVLGTTVTRVVVGPDAGATDLRRIARALRGRNVSAGTWLAVMPGSRLLHEMAQAEGTLDALLAAGAVLHEGGTPAGAGGIGGAGLCCGLVRAEDLPEAGRGQWWVASAESCAAAALVGGVADPRDLDWSGAGEEQAPCAVGDALLPPAGAGAEAAEEWHGPNHRPLPMGRGLEPPMRGALLARFGDRVAAAAVIPWGPRLDPLRGDIAALAEHAFSALDPGFAARAGAHAGGFVAAGEDYGTGPAPEHAALALAALGVRAVLARSFAPAHRRQLVNAGVLPLRLARASDLAALEPGDEIEIPGLPATLVPGAAVVMRNLTRGEQCSARLDLAAGEGEVVAAGGMLAHTARLVGTRVGGVRW